MDVKSEVKLDTQNTTNYDLQLTSFELVKDIIQSSTPLEPLLAECRHQLKRSEIQALYFFHTNDYVRMVDVCLDAILSNKFITPVIENLFSHAINIKGVNFAHICDVLEANITKSSTIRIQYAICLILLNDQPDKLSQAYSLMEQEAKNNPEALNVLAYCKFNGIAVEQNEVEAVNLYRIARDQGSIAAVNNLGYCLEFGRGVETDPNLAFEYYQEASNRGIVTSIYNVACCLENGIGTQKDMKRALPLYELATDLGDLGAILSFAHFCKYGVEGFIDQARAGLLEVHIQALSQKT